MLPRTRQEIRSSCSCPDWANPCKHVAGVYYHVASLLDRDPLLLFEFRGMDRRQLRQAVSQSEFGAALLGDAGSGDPDLAAAVREPRFPLVEESGSETPASDLRAFWRGRPLAREVTAEGQAPPVSALLLRREGDYPEFWHRDTSFLETMAGVYERVAKGIPPETRRSSSRRRPAVTGVAAARRDLASTEYFKAGGAQCDDVLADLT